MPDIELLSTHSQNSTSSQELNTLNDTGCLSGRKYSRALGYGSLAFSCLFTTSTVVAILLEQKFQNENNNSMEKVMGYVIVAGALWTTLTGTVALYYISKECRSDRTSPSTNP